MTAGAHTRVLVLAAALLAPAAVPAAGPAAGPAAPASANRLVGETSPYLLLHARDPVDWYPWGPEALGRARAEDRPIFLSIGYSTCYWCHVMEREVFANLEIAALMNQWFVNVKVDREERPDLDRIYLTATQLVSGSAGWPASVFLTPALAPFFAGTYFPPRETAGQTSFPRILEAMHTAWTERRGEVDDVAAMVVAQVRNAEAGVGGARAPDAGLVAAAVRAVKARYDAQDGGFGGAPKFPDATRLELLLRVADEEGDAAARRIVDHCLAAMAAGGLRDHVGGGFHRYATDARWRVPHFEKMLYNQAQMAHLYGRAFALTGDGRWRRVAEEVLAFVRRELTAPQGGYYTALDAESEGVEGKYYTWTEAQVQQALGAPRAGALLDVYGLAPVPDGAGAALYLRRPEASRASLDASLEALRDARARRVPPLRDDKVIASWNGMMIAAAAEAGAALGDTAAVAGAARAARFVLTNLRGADGGLLRSWRTGVARGDAFLEDYVHLAEGLLALHAATGDGAWLAEAARVADELVRRFEAPEGGFYFSADGADLLARSTVAEDGALPSPNAVAVQVLLELARCTGRDELRATAGRALTALGGRLAAAPEAHVALASAARDFLRGGSAPAHAARSPVAGDAAAPAPPRSGALPGADGALSSEPSSRTGAGDWTPAPAPDSLLRVDATLTPERPAPGQVASLRLRLRIADGWHVNANPASAGLVPTSVTVNPGDLPARIVGIEYPAPDTHYVSALAERLAVYTGQVQVGVRLALGAGVAPGTAGAVSVAVRYQACDETRCLLPAEVVRRVEVTVGAPSDAPER